jgi:hypothetical protein
MLSLGGSRLSAEWGRNCLSSKPLMSECHSNTEFSMTVPKPLGLLATATVLVSIPVLSAIAQTQAPASPSTGTPPATTRPEIVVPPAQRQVNPPAPRSEGSTTTATKVSPLLGLPVFSSEGSKLGSVRSVEAGTNGATTAIYLKTGGFLGFGGKLVAIPVGKFTQDPEKIVVHMSGDEISKLPAIEEQG